MLRLGLSNALKKKKIGINLGPLGTILVQLRQTHRTGRYSATTTTATLNAVHQHCAACSLRATQPAALRPSGCGVLSVTQPTNNPPKHTSYRCSALCHAGEGRGTHRSVCYLPLWLGARDHRLSLALLRTRWPRTMVTVFRRRRCCCPTRLTSASSAYLLRCEQLIQKRDNHGKA